MRARYKMRVRQGNNVHCSVEVTVIASSPREAHEKAMAMAGVHNPVPSVVSVEEACACGRETDK